MTEKQIKASRANGALSHGPKTEEGKRRSSQNATQHGLLAKLIVLRHEKAEGLLQLLKNYEEEFNSTTQTHDDLICDLAAARYRLARAWMMQKQKVDDAVDPLLDIWPNREINTNLTDGLCQCEHQIELLLRYETGLHREYHRAYDKLVKLRDRGDLNYSSAEDAGLEEHDSARPEGEDLPHAA